jgi:hypothetical protein
MKRDEFKIGMEFTNGAHVWRCTDVGSRVVVGIKIGPTIQIQRNGSLVSLKTFEAQAEGWFNGPPYSVGERVFDEYELQSCRLGV